MTAASGKADSGAALLLGDYVLATKWSDGDPGDAWAVGFYDREHNGRHYVKNGDGQQIRANGYRKVAKIPQSLGFILLKAADGLERTEPGSINLWELIAPLIATPTANGPGEADGWLPIESAPKDECVLLRVPTTLGKWNKYLPLPGYWEHRQPESSGFWVTYNHDEAIGRVDPTHWQPLPTPPKNGGK